MRLLIAGCLALAGMLGTAPSSSAAAVDIREVAEYSGILVPAREAEITPIVSAWRRGVNFVSGQMVKKGDPMFLFHTKPAELRLHLAQAKLEKAEANVGLAELGVLQMTQLAPFDGVMSAPMVRENGWQDISKSGDGGITMAIITQLDPIHLVAELPYDIYAERMRHFGSDQAFIDGLVLLIALPDGTLYPHYGHLVSGGYTFDEDSQKIKVWGEFPNPDHFLRPGFRVTVQSQLNSD
ncbi:efflux RND transporter periplasmic adaptor subunit [Ruegeria marisrubri]|nr:hypothetical protein [Ruegeria marisrubri]